MAHEFRDTTAAADQAASLGSAPAPRRSPQSPGGRDRSSAEQKTSLKAAKSLKLSESRKPLANRNSIDRKTGLDSVHAGGRTLETMERGSVILKKLQAACASVLDDAGVAATKKKQVLGSLAATARQELTSKKQPVQIPAPVAASGNFDEPSLPKGPPGGKLWTKHRKKGETPARYIVRVYGSAGANWLAKGMTLKQLRARDKVLVSELYRWRKNNKLPKELEGRLPTLKQRNDKILNSYALTHGPAGGRRSVAKELTRLRSACQRRPEFSV